MVLPITYVVMPAVTKSLSQKYLYGDIVREVSDGCYVLYGNNWYLTVITAKF